MNQALLKLHNLLTQSCQDKETSIEDFKTVITSFVFPSAMLQRCFIIKVQGPLPDLKRRVLEQLYSQAEGNHVFSCVHQLYRADSCDPCRKNENKLKYERMNVFQIKKGEIQAQGESWSSKTSQDEPLQLVWFPLQDKTRQEIAEMLLACSELCSVLLVDETPYQPTELHIDNTSNSKTVRVTLSECRPSPITGSFTVPAAVVLMASHPQPALVIRHALDSGASSSSSSSSSGASSSSSPLSASPQLLPMHVKPQTPQTESRALLVSSPVCLSPQPVATLEQPLNQPEPWTQLLSPELQPHAQQGSDAQDSIGSPQHQEAELAERPKYPPPLSLSTFWSDSDAHPHPSSPFVGMDMDLATGQLTSTAPPSSECESMEVGNQPVHPKKKGPPRIGLLSPLLATSVFLIACSIREFVPNTSGVTSQAPLPSKAPMAVHRSGSGFSWASLCHALLPTTWQRLTPSLRSRCVLLLFYVGVALLLLALTFAHLQMWVNRVSRRHRLCVALLWLLLFLGGMGLADLAVAHVHRLVPLLDSEVSTLTPCSLYLHADRVFGNTTGRVINQLAILRQRTLGGPKC